jgi:hypothetical protein
VDAARAGSAPAGTAGAARLSRAARAPLTVTTCESDDPWRGHRPKYEKLVMKSPRSFGMTTRLPSGETSLAPIRTHLFTHLEMPPVVRCRAHSRPHHSLVGVGSLM